MLYLLVALFLWTTPAHAATAYDTDFETCTVGTGNDFPCENWNDFAQESVGHLEVENIGPFISGSKYLRGTFTNTSATNGNNGNQPSIFNSTMPTATSRHMFQRVAVRLSSGFQICANGHTKMVRVKDSGSYAHPGTNGQAYPMLWIHYRNGTYQMVMESPYSGGTLTWSSGVTPRFGQWDQIEVEWDLNTPGASDGAIRMWVNDQLKVTSLNHQFVGPAVTSVCTGTSGSGSLICPSTLAPTSNQVYMQCGLGTIDFDRIAVGTTRIGIVGSPPLPDTQAPSPPTSVAAQ